MSTINTVITKLRKANGIKQKNLFMGIYSRSLSYEFEHEKRSVLLSDLTTILENLDFFINELVEQSPGSFKTPVERENDKINTILINNPSKISSICAKEIKSIYVNAASNKFKSVAWMNFYIFLKIKFYSTLDFIDEPNQEDLKVIKHMSKSRKSKTVIDFKLALNCLCYYPLKKMMFLIDSIFPIESVKGEFEKKYLLFLLNNIITICIYEKKLDDALNYIDILDGLLAKELDYKLKLLSKFSKNLVFLLQTNSIDAYKEIIYILDIIKYIGDDGIYYYMKNGLQDLLTSNNITIPNQFAVLKEKDLSKALYIDYPVKNK